jgi:hypothetical protein
MMAAGIEVAPDQILADGRVHLLLDGRSQERRALNNAVSKMVEDQQAAALRCCRWQTSAAPWAIAMPALFV